MLISRRRCTPLARWVELPKIGPREVLPHGRRLGPVFGFIARRMMWYKHLTSIGACATLPVRV
jgi:hypothetical protein